MTIGERFKIVRTLADEPGKKCSQTKFGELFGLGRDAVANIENNRVEPSQILIESICNRFCISYDWLAHGVDPMRLPISREEEITEYVTKTLNGSSDFKKAVVRMICSRSDEELAVLVDMLQTVYENIKKE